MDNFWKNVLRYVRFAISSIFGLILVILAPLINVTKKKSILGITTFVIGLIILFQVIKNMSGLD